FCGDQEKRKFMGFAVVAGCGRLDEHSPLGLVAEHLIIGNRKSVFGFRTTTIHYQDDFAEMSASTHESRASRRREIAQQAGCLRVRRQERYAFGPLGTSRRASVSGHGDAQTPSV